MDTLERAVRRLIDDSGAASVAVVAVRTSTGGRGARDQARPGVPRGVDDEGARARRAGTGRGSRRARPRRHARRAQRVPVARGRVGVRARSGRRLRARACTSARASGSRSASSSRSRSRSPATSRRTCSWTALGAERGQRDDGRMGAPTLVVRRGVEDDAAWRAGLNNTVTAGGLATLLLAIARGEAVVARGVRGDARDPPRPGVQRGDPAPACRRAWSSRTRPDRSRTCTTTPRSWRRRAQSPYVLVVLTEGSRRPGSRRRSSPRSPARCTRSLGTTRRLSGPTELSGHARPICLGEQPLRHRRAHVRPEAVPGEERVGALEPACADPASRQDRRQLLREQPLRGRLVGADRRLVELDRGDGRVVAPVVEDRVDERPVHALQAELAAQRVLATRLARGPGTPPRRARTRRRRGTRARASRSIASVTRSARYPSRVSLRRTSATERCRASRNRAPASRTCAGSSTSARCARRSAGVGLRGRTCPERRVARPRVVASHGRAAAYSASSMPSTGSGDLGHLGADPAVDLARRRPRSP